MLKRTVLTISAAYWVLGLLASGCTTVPQPPMPPSQPIISLTKPVHFSAPDGSDVVVSPGLYVVEPAAESQLNLIPEEGKQSLVIQGVATSYKETLPAGSAWSIPGKEDEHHVVLLLPGGKSIDALGSYSGVRTRAQFFAAKLSTIELMCCAPTITSVSPASVTYGTVVTVQGNFLGKVLPERACILLFCAYFVKVSESPGYYGEVLFLRIMEWTNGLDGTTITFKVSSLSAGSSTAYAFRSLRQDEAGSSTQRFSGLPGDLAPSSWSGRLRFKPPLAQQFSPDNYYSLTGPTIVTWTRP